MIGFTAPGGPDFNTDKDKTGVRYDTTAIANGVIKTGAACDMLDSTRSDADAAFEAKLKAYDAFIARINPGQIDGARRRRARRCGSTR